MIWLWSHLVSKWAQWLRWDVWRQIWKIFSPDLFYFIVQIVFVWLHISDFIKAVVAQVSDVAQGPFLLSLVSLKNQMKANCDAQCIIMHYVQLWPSKVQTILIFKNILEFSVCVNLLNKVLLNADLKNFTCTYHKFLEIKFINLINFKIS